MVWMLVIGLLVWVVFVPAWVIVLIGRVRALTDRLARIERRLLLAESEAPRAQPASPAPDKPFEVEVARRPARPAAAEAAAPPPRVRAATPAPPPEPQPAPARTEAAPPRASRPETRALLANWMAENGLAWIGGAVLALGGLFLVSYAAQRGMFTPPFRIAAAVVLGLALLGASEWLRRAQADQGLAAAVSAGAGAATLYAAVWASYWLYSFIDLGPAGALLGAISLWRR